MLQGIFQLSLSRSEASTRREASEHLTTKTIGQHGQNILSEYKMNPKQASVQNDGQWEVCVSAPMGIRAIQNRKFHNLNSRQYRGLGPRNCAQSESE